MIPMHTVIDAIRGMRSNGKTLPVVLAEIADGFRNRSPWIKYVGSERRVRAAALYVYKHDLI